MIPIRERGEFTVNDVYRTEIDFGRIYAEYNMMVVKFPIETIIAEGKS